MICGPEWLLYKNSSKTTIGLALDNKQPNLQPKPCSMSGQLIPNSVDSVQKEGYLKGHFSKEQYSAEI